MEEVLRLLGRFALSFKNYAARKTLSFKDVQSEGHLKTL